MNLNDVLTEWGSFLGPKRNTTPTVPDIETPRWMSADEQGLADESGLLDNDGQMTFRVQDHGHAGIRTIHGLIDLGSDLAEEVIDWENKQEAEKAEKLLPEDLRKALAPAPRPFYTLANILPARSFRTDTLVIPAGNAELTDNWTLLSNRSDRMWIEIVNQGANPLLLSFTDDPNVLTVGGFPAFTIPAVSSTITTTTPPPGTTPAQPAVPTSTTLVQNVNPYPVLVTLSGFTLTAVNVNGQQVGTTNAAYIVPSGQAISVTYTVQGTWTWAAVPVTTSVPTTATPIPRRLQIGGKVYAYSVLGTTIDYVEAYGLRNFELDYVNP